MFCLGKRRMAPATLQRLNFAGFDFDDLLRVGQAPPLRPHLELVETQGAYRVEAEVAELEAHELTIRVGADFLEIAGRHVERSTWPLAVCFLASGERELRFARRFPLRDADPRKAEARLVDGELWVRVPKREHSEIPFAGAVSLQVSPS